MKRTCVLILGVMGLFLTAGGALAHFGMVIPSDNMVMQGDPRDVKVILSFSHPMEMVGMDMGKPKEFGAWANGREEELTGTLRETKVMGRKAWEAEYRIKRPGVYLFHMEPQPYWEPAEDCYIVHITKTVVAAFGDDEGWDHELGLKTEIVPLARPYGLYAGNVFQGIVKMNGKPVAYAGVEVEYYNRDGKAKAPTDYMLTQSLKADQNGVFTFAVPHAGWWGFAALNTGDYKIKREGEDKDVELGAVIWVKFEEWHQGR